MLESEKYTVGGILGVAWNDGEQRRGSACYELSPL